MSFFSELKRRNVFRVGVAYLIGAWLLAQIADLLIDNIGAPDWVMKTLFVALALGFPIALFFAWAFELTPEGVKRESEVDRSQSITNVTGRKLDRSIIVILLLALGYFAWDKFSAETPSTAQVAKITTSTVEEAVIDKSIAVLPFVNMSADADNEYFSDGLSEELLNLLAKVDGLKVAARTSSFKFKNSEADIAEIGQKLNVATVLEGSVRKSGNQARITAQLIKVDDGFHLWSETYDRELDNIFVVQDEIAKAIVDALKLPLLGHDAKPLTSTAATGNFAAYDLYLLGRHHARAFTEEGFSRAIDYYLQALEIDPTFAAAYSGLADGYIFLADFGNMPTGEAYQLAQTAAEKALSIDSGSPEAHTSMGLVLNNLSHEREAEVHFLKALEVNPNHVDAMLYYRGSLKDQFRVREATRMAERAMLADPLSYSVRRALADQFMHARQYEDSLKIIQEFLAANPEDPTPYEIWGDLFLQRGLPQSAIPMYRNAHRLRPGDIYMAYRNVQASLQLHDETLVAYWLEEARKRGADAQWTRRAERDILFARGDFSGLLEQVDQALETLPGHLYFRRLRAMALASLGKTDAARDTLRLVLESAGYVSGQALMSNELHPAVELANLLDQQGAADERDALLDKIEELLKRLHQAEPPVASVSYIAACAASVRNDLPGVLSGLKAAVDAGFRDHWKLLTDPVFKRWQDNPEFIAFHQGMLDAAARMRAEYYVNNPSEQAAPEGTN